VSCLGIRLASMPRTVRVRMRRRCGARQFCERQRLTSNSRAARVLGFLTHFREGDEKNCFRHSKWPARAALCTMVSTRPCGSQRASGRIPAPLVIGHRARTLYAGAHAGGLRLAIELGADSSSRPRVGPRTRHLTRVRAEHDRHDRRGDRPSSLRAGRTAIIDEAADTGSSLRLHAGGDQAFARGSGFFERRSSSRQVRDPTLERSSSSPSAVQGKDRPIGIYPEVSIRLITSPSAADRERCWPFSPRPGGTIETPLIIQSFEQSNLKELRS